MYLHSDSLGVMPRLSCSIVRILKYRKRICEHLRNLREILKPRGSAKRLTLPRL